MPISCQGRMTKEDSSLTGRPTMEGGKAAGHMLGPIIGYRHPIYPDTLSSLNPSARRVLRMHGASTAIQQPLQIVEAESQFLQTTAHTFSFNVSPYLSPIAWPCRKINIIRFASGKGPSNLHSQPQLGEQQLCIVHNISHAYIPSIPIPESAQLRIDGCVDKVLCALSTK